MFKKQCDRCNISFKNGIVHTTSKLSTETICMNCKEKEKKMKIYGFADRIEVQEVRKGNMKFEGVLESEDYCLVECELSVQDTVQRFKFIGTFILENDSLEFDEVYVLELTDNKLKEFEITSTTFTGGKLDSLDAIGDVISRYSRKADDFRIISIHKDIEAYIEKLREKGSVTINGKEIPKNIYYGWDLREYELLLATEEYLHYADCDSYLILDAKTGAVISDNNFAEEGYYQSIKSISKGTETLVYLQDENVDSYSELMLEILKEE